MVIRIFKEFVLEKDVQKNVLRDYLCLKCGKNEVEQIQRSVNLLLQKFLKIEIERQN